MIKNTSIAMFTLFALVACEAPDVDVDLDDVVAGLNLGQPSAFWKLKVDGEDLKLKSYKVHYLAYKDGTLLLGQGFNDDKSVQLVVEMNQTQQWPPLPSQRVVKDAEEAGVVLIRGDGRWGSTDGEVSVTWGKDELHRLTLKFDVTLTHEEEDRTLHLVGEVTDNLNINCLPQLERPSNEDEAKKLVNDSKSFLNAADTQMSDPLCQPLKACKEWFTSKDSQASCSAE